MDTVKSYQDFSEMTHPTINTTFILNDKAKKALCSLYVIYKDHMKDITRYRLIMGALDFFQSHMLIGDTNFKKPQDKCHRVTIEVSRIDKTFFLDLLQSVSIKQEPLCLSDIACLALIEYAEACKRDSYLLTHD